MLGKFVFRIIGKSYEKPKITRVRLQALLDACHKRARPIVMTTIAMIAGMLPIALGLGADASFRQPMAVAVSGGLLTSTGLSLLVVPVVFSLLNDFEHWIKEQFASRQDSNAVLMQG